MCIPHINHDSILPRPTFHLATSLSNLLSFWKVFSKCPCHVTRSGCDVSTAELSQEKPSPSPVSPTTDIGRSVMVTFDSGSHRSRLRANAAFPAESSTFSTTENIPGAERLNDGKSLSLQWEHGKRNEITTQIINSR